MNSSSTLSYRSNSPSTKSQNHYSTLPNHHLHHHHQLSNHLQQNSNSASPVAGGSGSLQQAWWSANGLGTNSPSASSSVAHYGASNGSVAPINGTSINSNFIYSPHNMIANNRRANDF